MEAKLQIPPPISLIVVDAPGHAPKPSLHSGKKALDKRQNTHHPNPQSQTRSLFLGGEVGLEAGATVVVGAAAGARVCQLSVAGSNVVLNGSRNNIPWARFPQAHVESGILFSVAALSQAESHNQYMDIELVVRLGLEDGGHDWRKVGDVLH